MQVLIHGRVRQLPTHERLATDRCAPLEYCHVDHLGVTGRFGQSYSFVNRVATISCD